MREPDDWRLMGQESYLKGKNLVFRAYQQNSKSLNWDHDHCEFCGAKFSLLEETDVIKEGYATEDEYYWICGSCFEDFKDMFEWRIVKTD